MLRIALLFAFFTAAAVAQTNEDSSLKVKSESVRENPALDDTADVDNIITNPKLRTETGSKSKWSINSGFGYSGGTLARPFGDQRPNITGAVATTDVPALSGSIAGKYNFDARNSIFGGVGLRWVAPLSGAQAPPNYKGDRFDVDNPYYIYQYLYNLAGLQSSVQLRQTWITTSDVSRKGFLTSWGLGQTSIYEIGKSGFSVGFNTYVGLAYFTKHTPELKKEQSDYSWAFMPAIEYRLSDKWNLRLDTNLFVFEHMRSSTEPLTFRRLDVSQNFNIGYSLTRDIYLSTGCSFDISNLRGDRTNWGFGGSMNLF